jgi:hypothetical protein
VNTSWHFPFFIAVSFLLFLGVLRLALRARVHAPSQARVISLAAVVVIGGMCFAKYGATHGFPVWLYYGLPAGLTWLLPPWALRMSGREFARYVPLALLVAPAIHVCFSLLLGWKEYMPFLPVPSLRDLFG